MIKIALPMIGWLLLLMILLTSGPLSDLARGEEPPQVARPPDLPPEQPGPPAIRCPLTPKQRGGVSSLAFSPAGKVLAAGNGEGMVKLYDPATARELASYQVRDWIKGGIDALAYSPDGKALVAEVGMGEVVLLDPADGRTRLALEVPTFAHQLGVFPLVFSPDGKAVAAGYGNGEIALWDAESGRLRATLPAQVIPEHREGPFQKVVRAHPAGVTSLVFSPDGTTLASLSFDSPLRFWDPATGKERACPIRVGRSRCAAFSPDGKILALSDAAWEPSKARYVNTLWDVATGRKRSELPTREMVSGLAFLSDGRSLVSLEGGQVVRLWDVNNGRQSAGLRFEHHCKADILAVSPDGKLIAAGGYSSDPMFGIIQLIETDGTNLSPWKPRP